MFQMINWGRTTSWVLICSGVSGEMFWKQMGPFPGSGPDDLPDIQGSTSRCWSAVLITKFNHNAVDSLPELNSQRTFWQKQRAGFSRIILWAAAAVLTCQDVHQLLCWWRKCSPVRMFTSCFADGGRSADQDVSKDQNYHDKQKLSSLR